MLLCAMIQMSVGFGSRSPNVEAPFLKTLFEHSEKCTGSDIQVCGTSGKKVESEPNNLFHSNKKNYNLKK